MPYAADGQVSQDPIDGGIEITDTQYAEAIAGMMEGKVVSIDGGFSVSVPEPEPDPEPDPPPSLPVPQLTAVALLQVVDEEVITVGVAAGVSFAMRLDTGLIWLFFSQEMPDLSYSYSYTVLPSSGRATVTDRQLSYMEITITDADGNPVDPGELSVQVYRAI